MAKLPDDISHIQVSADADEIRIPVVQETMDVSKKVVETGSGVRVTKTVTEHEQVVDLALMHDEVTVEHVAINSIVDAASRPGVRYEGNTMVVPVFEEVLLVEKQLRLKEEVRITRHQRERHQPQTVVLKTETATVERFNESPAAGPTSSSQGE